MPAEPIRGIRTFGRTLAGGMLERDKQRQQEEKERKKYQDAREAQIILAGKASPELQEQVKDFYENVGDDNRYLLTPKELEQLATVAQGEAEENQAAFNELMGAYDDRTGGMIDWNEFAFQEGMPQSALGTKAGAAQAEEQLLDYLQFAPNAYLLTQASHGGNVPVAGLGVGGATWLPAYPLVRDAVERGRLGEQMQEARIGGITAAEKQMTKDSLLPSEPTEPEKTPEQKAQERARYLAALENEKKKLGLDTDATENTAELNRQIKRKQDDVLRRANAIAQQRGVGFDIDSIEDLHAAAFGSDPWWKFGFGGAVSDGPVKDAMTDLALEYEAATKIVDFYEQPPEVQEQIKQKMKALLTNAIRRSQ